MRRLRPSTRADLKVPGQDRPSECDRTVPTFQAAFRSMISLRSQWLRGKPGRLRLCADRLGSAAFAMEPERKADPQAVRFAASYAARARGFNQLNSASNAAKAPSYSGAERREAHLRGPARVSPGTGLLARLPPSDQRNLEQWSLVIPGRRGKKLRQINALSRPRARDNSWHGDNFDGNSHRTSLTRRGSRPSAHCPR